MPGVNPTVPRVLLVEDDASIRRFVEMALEEEPLHLVQADTVAAALRALREQGPFRLVFTDLMLPDGSGRDVLQALQAEPALRAGARVAVFSAGLSAETRAALVTLGVDDIIAKPASLAQLLQCAQAALAATPAVPAADTDPRRTAQAAAVEQYFAGNQALYDAFRASCLQQFAADRVQGDAALAAADWQALRRVGHSLKTVLLTLGHDGPSELARQLEADAAHGRHDAARQRWLALAAALSALA